MSTMQVEVVSAENEIFSGEATMLIATAAAGELGIYPQHTPLLTNLKPGDVRVQTADGEEQVIYVSGGILEVTPRKVTVLSDTAIRADDLDEAAALEAQRKAEQALKDSKADIDYARAKAEMAQAAAQLQALKKRFKRRT
ncbi:ATP synthase epsilon chain [Arenicella chitinivorans]|uniref:ATP synthase epsilon chain n=1 Tax=Arenicella chitinivorans TaxID=1329800 RepID=A0A918RWP9_9GAMM|nr:F0F1 ATP synthase subunit epsilon [Arenicella chitinivorans]GHA14099.1 ATP synthase epsilon chain [Arenicella chitinivorans]